MRRIVFLLTMLLPLFAVAQSTAVLDGGYIANVYGQSNYVKNPNAQKNTVNVTTTQTSTITRSTTTPLMATTEFNIADSGAWDAVWSTRALDAGMKNQQCEAKIKLRGAAGGTTTFSAIQNSVAVATLTVVLDATNPKTYSLYFPCGDLTYATTLSLAGSAAITQTIEAGAVYFGGQVTVSSGTISTEWQTATVTGTWNTNVTYSAKYRRVATNAEYRVRISTSGAPNSTGLLLTLPNTIDTAQFASASGAVKFGNGTARDNGVADYPVEVNLYNATQVSIAPGNSSSTYTTQTAYVDSTVPFTFGASDSVDVVFSVPITGWSATDVVTPESTISGQARYTTNTAQSIPNTSATIVDFEDKDYDINNEVTTGAAWKFTAKSPGYYHVSARVLFGNSSAWNAGEYAALRIVKNGNDVLRTDGKTADATVTQNMPAEANGTLYLNTGDYVQITALQTTGGALSIINDGLYNSVSVTKISGSGNQSVYISSPLVADPTTNTIKAKNTSGVDVLSIDGATSAHTVGVAGATTAPILKLNTGTTGLNWGSSTIANGQIMFGNASNLVAIPSIYGRSSANAGLFLSSFTNDSNTAGDMLFSIYEEDGTGHATTSRKAYSWYVGSGDEIAYATRAGAWTFPLIHFTSSPAGNLNSGTYTPTLTGVTNVASTSAATTRYTRVGNVVFVSGTAAIDTTSTGLTQFDVSLPIASNLAAGSDLTGTFTRDESSSYVPGACVGEVTNDRAACVFYASYTSASNAYFSFSYEVK